jgi:hypothetical protein
MKTFRASGIFLKVESFAVCESNQFRVRLSLTTSLMSGVSPIAIRTRFLAANGAIPWFCLGLVVQIRTTSGLGELATCITDIALFHSVSSTNSKS